MSLTLCVLASSSSANCIYVASPSTALLFDAGLSARETERRLDLAGLDRSRIAAVCVSHEHTDHVAGLPVLQRRNGWPVYANAGTREGMAPEIRDALGRWNLFTTGAPFDIGDLRIEPFLVPHDAYEPVGFVVRRGETRIGIATDFGIVTTLLRERLRACPALVLETNHDEQMLRNSSRPWPLKQRILGRQGHLSNRVAADLVADLAGPHLRHVFLAHLSRECNDQDLARREVGDRLAQAGHAHVQLHLTYPDRISDLVVL